MGAAKYGEPAPPPLTLAFWCGDNHLPDVGGVLDQDYTTYKRMMSTRNVYDAIIQAKRAKGAEIHKLHPATKRTIKYLRDQGLM